MERALISKKVNNINLCDENYHEILYMSFLQQVLRHAVFSIYNNCHYYFHVAFPQKTYTENSFIFFKPNRQKLGGER